MWVIEIMGGLVFGFVCCIGITVVTGGACIGREQINALNQSSGGSSSNTHTYTRDEIQNGWL